MTNNINNFMVPLILTKKRLFKRYGVMIEFIGEGISKWRIVDGDGKLHSIINHNINYTPEATTCLI